MLEKKIEVLPATEDHGTKIRFVVKGDGGAIVFAVNTGWYQDGSGMFGSPECTGIEAHVRIENGEYCQYTGGGCEYHLLFGARELFNLLVRQGDGAVFAEMERLYHHWCEE